MKTLIGLKFKEDDREADSDRKEQGSELMSSGETAVNLAFVFGKIEADVGHAERAEERQACMLAPENEGIISRECDCRFLTEIDTGYLPRRRLYDLVSGHAASAAFAIGGRLYQKFAQAFRAGVGQAAAKGSF
jgi:hypothetical protein